MHDTGDRVLDYFVSHFEWCGDEDNQELDNLQDYYYYRMTREETQEEIEIWGRYHSHQRSVKEVKNVR